MPAQKVRKTKKVAAASAEAAGFRGQRRALTGVVTSDKMSQTVSVSVERFVRHPKFGKYLKRYTTCYVHDEREDASVGDRVEIVETRPLSRLKRWRLVRVVRKSTGLAEPVPADAETSGPSSSSSPPSASSE